MEDPLNENTDPVKVPPRVLSLREPRPCHRNGMRDRSAYSHRASQPPTQCQPAKPNRRSEVSWWHRRIASQVIWLERQDAELVRRKPAPIVRGAKAMDGELV